MRIVQITDLHDNAASKTWLETAASKYDAVFISGDIGFEIIGDVANTIKQHPNIFAVNGNHDHPLNYGCSRILHGTKVRFKGYTIGGLGGSLPIGGWPFEIDDTEYSILCGNLGPVDIFISHEPPYFTNIDINFQKQHCGSAAIAKYIEKTQPILGMFGHIHESSAIGKIGRTIIANPGPFYEGRYLEADIAGHNVTRAKVFYNKALEWPSWENLLRQSRQKHTWGAPSLDRSRKA